MGWKIGRKKNEEVGREKERGGGTEAGRKLVATKQDTTHLCKSCKMQIL